MNTNLISIVLCFFFLDTRQKQSKGPICQALLQGFSAHYQGPDPRTQLIKDNVPVRLREHLTCQSHRPISMCGTCLKPKLPHIICFHQAKCTCALGKKTAQLVTLPPGYFQSEKSKILTSKCFTKRGRSSTPGTVWQSTGRVNVSAHTHWLQSPSSFSFYFSVFRLRDMPNYPSQTQTAKPLIKELPATWVQVLITYLQTNLYKIISGQKG